MQQQEEMQAYGEEEPGVDEEGNEYQVQVEEQDEGEDAEEEAEGMLDVNALDYFWR